MPTYVLNPAKGETLANQIGRLNTALAPGDVIELLAGDHGDVVLTKALPGRVSITGRTGNVIRSLKVAAPASNWFLAYVNFRGFNPSADVKAVTRMVDVAQGCKSITFSGCSFAASDDVSEWSGQDWVSKPYSLAALVRGEDCLVANSAFFNLRNCLSLSGPGGVARGNTFRDFGNDAIQFGAGGIKILGNKITRGRHTPLEPLHADGMQGYPAPNGQTHTDVLIEGNVIDMNGAPGDYLQGISAFDGKWASVRVLNNHVRINAWHAITWFGVDGIEIAGNTVERSDKCDPKLTPWISVDKAKDGRPSSGIKVHGNKCDTYRLPPGVRR